VEAVLHTIAYYVALAAETVAIAIIAFGIVEAVIEIVRVTWGGRATGFARRAVWFDFARWLVAALTFQLAADIVSTSFSPTWEEVGRLGAIAVIRTFLSFFLDRELDANRELQHAHTGEPVTRQSGLPMT
jgi:uncharacterized membrane protein